MDKDLLKSLNNLSEALQNIADYLEKDQGNKEQSPVTTTLQSIEKIEVRLRSIDKGVKQLIKSNKKIEKDQTTLLEISRRQSQERGGPETPLDTAGDKTKKSKLMDGVKMIVLIAVGILAIGLAFAVLGKVDFLSVIALAVALPLIAVAIQRLVESEITPGQAMQASLVMIAASFGIMGASFFLSAVRPIGFFQLLTTMMIAVAFYFVGTALAAMMNSMMSTKKRKFGPFEIEGEGISWSTIVKGVVFVPLIMIAMSIGIVFASMILSRIVPINIFKLFTAILIAGVFAVIAMSIGKLISATKEMETTDLTNLPMVALTLVAVCAAIVAASYLFQLIAPINFSQFLTAIAIAAVFGVLAYGISPLVTALGEITSKTAEHVGKLMIILVGAIVASSWIISLTAPVSFATMFKFVALSLAVSAAVLFMGLTIFVLDKLRVTTKTPKRMMDTAKNILIIAGTIAASSLIISLGLYTNYPSLWWTLTVSVSILAFGMLGLVFDKLGSIKKFKEGSKSILLVAATITATSWILSVGMYKNYPGIFWTLNVLVSIVAFGAVALVFGYFMKGGMNKYVTTGLGTIVGVSVAILAVSQILGLGNYGNYPGLLWTLRVLVAIGSFAALALPLGLLVSTPLGLGALAAGLVSMIAIAGAITLISVIFGSTTYTKYPGIIWTASVLLTIGAFSVVAAALGLGIIGTYGAGAAILATGFLAMIGISYGIVKLSEIFSSTSFDKYPSLVWSASVIGTLTMFGIAAAAFGLGAIGSLLIGPALMVGGFEVMKQISHKIVEISNILAGGIFEKGKYPSMDWAAGVSLMLMTISNGAFMFGLIYSTGIGRSILQSGLDAMALFSTGIVRVSNILAGGNYTGGPPESWAKGVSTSINAFAPVYKMLQDSSGFKGFFGGGPTPEEYTRAIETIVDGIVAAANKFSGATVAFNNPPPLAWAKGVSKAIGAFAGVLKIIADSDGSVTPMKMKRTILMITQAIIDSAETFNKNTADFDITKVPGVAWSNSVAAAIRAFKPVLSMVSDQYGSDTSWIKNTIKSVGDGMKSFAESLTGVTYPNIPPDFAPTAAKALSSFMPLLKFETEGWGDQSDDIERILKGAGNGLAEFAKPLAGVTFTVIPDGWVQSITSTVRGLMDLMGGEENSAFNFMKLQLIGYSFSSLASSIDQFSQSINKLSTELQNLDVDKLNAINRLTGSVVLLSLMDSTQFTSMMDALENKTEGFINVLNEMSKGGGGMEKVKTSEVRPATNQPQRTMDDLFRVMSSVDAKMSMVVSSSNNISSYINQVRSGEVVLDDKKK